MFKKSSNSLPVDPAPGGNELSSQVKDLQRSRMQELRNRVNRSKAESDVAHEKLQTARFGKLGQCSFCGTNRSHNWVRTQDGKPICFACNVDMGTFDESQYKSVIIHRIISGNWRGHQFNYDAKRRAQENERSGFRFFYECPDAEPMLPRWMYFDHSVIRRNMQPKEPRVSDPLQIVCVKCGKVNGVASFPEGFSVRIECTCRHISWYSASWESDG